MQSPMLTPDEINTLMRSQFGDDFYLVIQKFLKNAFNFSFKTDAPFVSSGIFFKNILKVYPEFSNELSRTSPNFFKNMIMHKGSTKIRINCYTDYQNIEKEFSNNYSLSAPKLDTIFKALVSDKKAIQKILDNEICMKHILEIFSNLQDHEWRNWLKDELINNLVEKIDLYEIKKRFEVDEITIENIDNAIKIYQEQLIKFRSPESELKI